VSNHEDLREPCRQAVRMAQSLGAQDVEVFAQETRDITTDIEKHDLQTSSSRQETIIGVRAMLDRQVGFTCTNILEELEASVANAVQLAKASPRDDNNRLPGPVAFDPVPDLHDPRAERCSASEVVGQAIRMIETAESMDRRLVLGSGEFSVHLQTRCIVTSQGIDLLERSSLFSCFALATAKDGERVSNMAFQFDASHSFDGIDVTRVARRACQDALSSLGAERGQSFVGPVILSPEAVLDVVVSLLSFQLSAKNALRGASRWGSLLGQQVACGDFHVVDNGRLPGGVATQSFDREGVPHREVTLIEAGTMQGLMHNSYTAHAMSIQNTAHASGGARSLPGISPTNLTILPGSSSKDDLIADIQNGLLVNRFSGSSNPISGDFSGVAKAAFHIQGGKIVRPVTGTLIAGNVFESLMSLSGISSETERVFSAVLPYLRLENISVTSEKDAV